jgi:hypothetical protein
MIKKKQINFMVDGNCLQINEDLKYFIYNK